MKSVLITLLLISAFSIYSCGSFAQNNKYSIRLYAQDTVSLDTTNVVSYHFFVCNLNSNNMQVKEYLTCGYSKDNHNDFYLEMYKIIGSEKIRSIEYTEHYPLMDYMGRYINLKKGGELKFDFISNLYPFRESGKYMFRVVFCNKYVFLGKSNWVVVHCIGRRLINNGW